MPPPRGTPNFLEGPGDYDVTSVVHSDTYDAINPSQVNLAGAAVFVAGGSKGFGRGIVLSYAKAGASFIAAGARSDMSELSVAVMEAAASANRPPPKFLPVQLDVTDENSVKAAVAVVKAEFGRCDIIVNNAGVLGPIKSVADSEPAQWWNILEVNLRGAYLVSHYFVPLLLESEGGVNTVINVGSVGAHLTTPGASAYQTSKLALLRLSQFLDRDHAAQGLISICIHPGNTLTDIYGDPEKISDTVMKLLVDTPELCGDTVVFLTSERREWLSGRYINVTWDMPELVNKRQSIEQGDTLKVKFIF